MLCTWGSQLPGWILAGASVDLNFAAGAYFPQSLDSSITTTRASTGYAQTSAGGLVLFGPNITRITDLGNDIEDPGTNLLLRSNDFSNAAWLQSNVTVSASANLAPDNTSSTQTITAGAGAAQHNLQQGPQTVSSGATVTNTVYAKYTNNPWIAVGIFDTSWRVGLFNVQTGALGTPSAGLTAAIKPLINGWYRLSITRAITGTNAYHGVFLMPSDTTTLSWTAAGTETVNLWQADQQVGAFATSPIPTTTVAVTRALDSEAAAGGLLTALQSPSGTVIVSLNQGIAGVTGTILGLNSLIGLGKTSGNALTTAFGGAQTSGNTATWTGRVKAGLRWTPTSVSIVLNGGTIVTAANTPPAVTAGYVGSTSGSSAAINQFIERLSVIPTAVSDSQFQAFTT